jgi:hypothetical protein
LEGQQRLAKLDLLFSLFALSVIFAQNLALQGGDVAQGRRSRPAGS